jgi:sugar phosphate isomerase/epimerase
MIRAMSTFVAVNERLNGSTLDALVRGGAQAIELFCAKQHFDYTDRVHVKEIGAWFKQNPIVGHSIHSPLYADNEWGRSGQPPINFIDNDKRQRIASMDEIKRAIEVAEVIPFKFMVQHIGVPNEGFDEQKFDHAMTAIEHLRAFAKPLGVTLLLENIPNDVSEPERLVEMIRTSHFSDVGMCFDFGHAHLMNGVVRDFEVMKPYIRSTHVDDNVGDRDSHLWPGEGGVDWKEAMDLLRTAPQAPPLLLEIEGVEGKDTVKAMQKVYELLEGKAVGR